MKRAASRLPPGADALYAGPLEAFVAAPNALEKKLRAQGDRSAAAEVKRLEKPSVSAWVVNRLWRDEREDFNRLFESREALQRASRAGDASALREAARDQSVVVARLRKRASESLTAATPARSPALLGRVTTTLRALASRGTFAPDPPGALTGDVEPSGFEAFGGLSVGGFPRKPKAPVSKGSSLARTTAPAKSPHAATSPASTKTRARARSEAKSRAAAQATQKAEAKARQDARRAQASAVATKARALAGVESKLVTARHTLEQAARRVRDLEREVATAREALTRSEAD